MSDDVLVDLDLITNLIAAGRLSIKIAYMPDGIYHEKIGIMRDDSGNALYFSGSANATVSGLKRNWESVLVLTTWWGDDELINDQEEYLCWMQATTTSLLATIHSLRFEIAKRRGTVSSGGYREPSYSAGS